MILGTREFERKLGITALVTAALAFVTGAAGMIFSLI
jgi:hypothetical protein